MRATQEIFRVRRQYNQWVANQTLEDYALRFTAKKARHWSAGQVSMTALGATAFLALEAIGGAITLNYGFINALIAMLTVGAVIFITGFPISYYAARHGLDIDLLTRGAGFGYLGSTITSLIYASFTFIFFAIEAAILSMALKALFGIPLVVGYVICALAVIPIVTHGITVISKFQIGTQPLWLTLQATALFAVLYFETASIADWTQYAGLESQGTPNPGSFNLLLFGAACSVLFAMVAQIGEQVDYLRFLPPKESTPALHWWAALIIAGPGWIFIGIIKMLAGSFLAFLAFRSNIPLELATDPTQMYQIAFNYLSSSPTVSLVLAGIMVIISQMKINVTNAYAGSIAWSNFFSRLTHSHPGRVVWLVFNVAIALLLMELGIYRALENILGIFAIVAVSWLGSVSADLLINRTLGLRPAAVEFKRAHLYDINPVGVGSMAIATTVGFLCYLNVFGEVAKSLAHFSALGTCYIMVPLIAWITQGRYYIARPPSRWETEDSALECCICKNEFEQEDMSQCPAYQGPICSLCCSLDARCHDICKPDARISKQIVSWLGKFLPARAVQLIDSRFSHFLAILAMISLLNAGMLALVYYHIAPPGGELVAILVDLLWTLFFVLMIISGILAWLFLLAHESRVVAQEESNRQNRFLVQEIDAHKETDLALQNAKELAEAANQAKSRYLSGISHELRTPLQSILGYAQILGRDTSIPEARKDAIDIVQRSGEYLADLIEGLLDISRIEAGRIDIRRDQVDLHGLLSEVVQLFHLQAESKSIDFSYHCAENLPRYVIADDKRLRQVLINLLTNAIKFTHEGGVKFEVFYRNQVAEFVISDTGIGISPENLERVFEPFERIRSPGAEAVPGTGLGLTIVRVLTEIMGGDISASSTLNQGSQFSAKLMLAPLNLAQAISPAQHAIIGYQEKQYTVLVVEDEPNHRQLMRELLVPLGFKVREAASAELCLELIEENRPDLYCLDVSMSGMSGLELASSLRQRQISAPIIMMSAAAEEPPLSHNSSTPYNAYLVKPIRINSLLDKFSQLLDITWNYDLTLLPPTPVTAPLSKTFVIPIHPDFMQLRSFAEIGYAKGFKDLLKQVELDGNTEPALIVHLNQLAQQVRFDKIVELLEAAES